MTTIASFISGLRGGLIETIRLPMPLLMTCTALIIGLCSSMPTGAVVTTFGQGFGRSLGEFALILLPSFIIAGALNEVDQPLGAKSPLQLLLIGPVAGAAMMCPDTAYNALSAMAPEAPPRDKLRLLSSVYAGFKLLPPAGPIIVATMLGTTVDGKLLVASVLAFSLAWISGLIFLGKDAVDNRKPKSLAATASVKELPNSSRPYVPILMIVALVGLGLVLPVIGWAQPNCLGFFVTPKGALIVGAIVAVAGVHNGRRREAVEFGVRRTAPLLLIIGCANALATFMAATLPLGEWAKGLAATGLGLPTLFLLAAFLKTIKGSSVVALAGSSSLILPILPTLNLSPVTATLAICCGAFIVIAPNDSLYWLARSDALYGMTETSAIRRLMGLSLVQGIVSFAGVYTLAQLHLL